MMMLTKLICNSYVSKYNSHDSVPLSPLNKDGGSPSHRKAFNRLVSLYAAGLNIKLNEHGKYKQAVKNKVYANIYIYRFNNF